MDGNIEIEDFLNDKGLGKTKIFFGYIENTKKLIVSENPSRNIDEMSLEEFCQYFDEIQVGLEKARSLIIAENPSRNIDEISVEEIFEKLCEMRGIKRTQENEQSTNTKGNINDKGNKEIDDNPNITKKNEKRSPELDLDKYYDYNGTKESEKIDEEFMNRNKKIDNDYNDDRGE